MHEKTVNYFFYKITRDNKRQKLGTMHDSKLASKFYEILSMRSIFKLTSVSLATEKPPFAMVHVHGSLC